MSDELREAAERYCKWSMNDYEGSDFCYEDDQCRLADAYLAEHPADDDTPIDEAWFSTLKQGKRSHYEVIRTKSGVLQLWIFAGDATTWMVIPIATRGRFRMFCKSLGIELKEGK